MSDSIRDEIKKQSKLGEAVGGIDINKSLDLLPTELSVAILVKAILSRKGEVCNINKFRIL